MGVGYTGSWTKKRRLYSGFVLDRTAGLGTRRSFGVGVRYVSIGRAFQFLVGWRIAFDERWYSFDHAWGVLVL